MSPYAKFGLDGPSRSASRRQPTDRHRHITFYMLDLFTQLTGCLGCELGNYIRKQMVGVVITYQDTKGHFVP